MRTFISIDIPEEVKKEIQKIQDNLPKFYGRKTELENLHLTLKFLGEIDEEKLEQVRRRLEKIQFKKFETEVKYVGFFDNIKRGKRYGPIWLYLKSCGGLQKIVDGSLEGLLEPEKRFMSHLTIARVKEIEDKKYFLDELKKIKIPKIKFKVDNFRLKKSTLAKQGPVYETLEKYNLD